MFPSLAPNALLLLLAAGAPGGVPSPLAPTRELCDANCGSGYGTPDLNSDGRVDFCDAMVFCEDLNTGNLRSDFSGDGDVDLQDDQIFGLCTCPNCATAPLPLPAAAQGTATIGVYFDAAGTVTSLSNVAAFTGVDFYVVAHGVPAPGMRGFTYRLDIGGLLGVSESPLVQFDCHLENTPTSTYTVGRAWIDECPTGDGVVLGRWSGVYTGGQDVEISVIGGDICFAPSESPSYVACGDSCEWAYFAPIPGVAVINPTDFNNNGVGDRFEVDTTQFYRFTGEPVDWSMGVQGPGGAGFNHQIPNNSLPVGAGVAELAVAFVSWIDSLASTVHAGIWDPGFGPGGFYVTIPGAQGFELGVGPPAGPTCWLPPATQCDFGPILEHLTGSTATDPARLHAGGFLTNYPNPFNPSTVIAFELPARASVTLRVYDAAGRAVRTLLSGHVRDAGRDEARWDGRDDVGHAMPAGVYFYRLEAGLIHRSRPMVLLK